jgi:hypothetical protein
MGRVLTKKDVPTIQALQQLWLTTFGLPVDRGTLIIWCQNYPEDCIRKAFGIAATWAAKRQPQPTEAEGYRYVSGILRNLYDAYKVAERLGVR